MMLAICAAKLLAGREVSGGPVAGAVLDEEVGLFAANVTLHCAADNGPGAWQVLQYLRTRFIYVKGCVLQDSLKSSKQ